MKLLALSLLLTASTFAQSGEVVLMGTGTGNCSGSPAGVIGTTGSYMSNGNTSCKMFDNDTTTRMDAPNADSDWAGLDLGVSAVVTRIRVAPRSSDGTSYFEYRLTGAVFKRCTTSSNCQSAGTTLYTYPSFDPTNPTVKRHIPRAYAADDVSTWLPQLAANEVPITTTASRYYGLVSSPNGYMSIAELQLIGTYTAGVTARPVAPSISPGSGAYLSGSTTVTITSLTTSASIYYTTDGSTPTNGSTLYAGPFTLTIGAATVLKAIAYDAGLSTTSSDVQPAFYRNYGFKPSEDWYDDQSLLLQSNGGGITWDSSTSRYYWVGMFLNSATAPVSGGNDDEVLYPGVWLYSSADLYVWRHEGELIDRITSGIGSTYLERPHIIWNASTSKWVLFVHLRTATKLLTATADAITGPYTVQSLTFDPDGLGVRDMNIFRDNDGTAYLIHTETTQQDVIICQLGSTYLTGCVGSTKTVYAGTHREAPVMFRRGSTYFVIASVANYYHSENTYDLEYITSSAPLGTYSVSANLWATDPCPAGVCNAFNGQSSFVLKVEGKTDAYFIGSDRWNVGGLCLYCSRQVWQPLVFADATTAQATSPASWDLTLWDPTPSSAIAGTFSIGGKLTIQ